MKQEVYYEWRQTLCPKCKNFGHELQDCRKLHKEEAELRGKQIEKKKQAGDGTSKEGGYNKGENRARVIRKETNEGNAVQAKNVQDKAIPTKNAFAILDKNIVVQSQGAISATVPEGEHDVVGPEHGMGGENPLPNG